MSAKIKTLFLRTAQMRLDYGKSTWAIFDKRGKIRETGIAPLMPAG